MELNEVTKENYKEGYLTVLSNTNPLLGEVWNRRFFVLRVIQYYYSFSFPSMIDCNCYVEVVYVLLQDQRSKFLYDGYKLHNLIYLSIDLFLKSNEKFECTSDWYRRVSVQLFNCSIECLYSHSVCRYTVTCEQHASRLGLVLTVTCLYVWFTLICGNIVS